MKIVGTIRFANKIKCKWTIRTKAKWNQCPEWFSQVKSHAYSVNKSQHYRCGSKMHDKMRERKRKKNKNENKNTIIIIYRIACDSMNCSRFFNETKIDGYWLYYFCCVFFASLLISFSQFSHSISYVLNVLTVFGSIPVNVEKNQPFHQYYYIIIFVFEQEQENEINSWLNNTGQCVCCSTILIFNFIKISFNTYFVLLLLLFVFILRFHYCSEMNKWFFVDVYCSIDCFPSIIFFTMNQSECN